MPTRHDIIRIAQTWIGTPYHHQASSKGVGTDCLGLLLGMWRELYGAMPEAPPPYSPDWAEASGQETLLDAARRHLVPIAREDLLPGDVLIFRYRRNTPAKHVAIYTAHNHMIHAIGGMAVCEHAFTPWWSRRLVATFAFPASPH